jgi:predicted ATPase with chaperone activity
MLALGGHGRAEAHLRPAAQPSRHPMSRPRASIMKSGVGSAEASPSNDVHERVTAARVRQAERFRNTRLLMNADIGPAEVRFHCQFDGAGQRLTQAAMRQLHLSVRAYHRVLKLARTIADLMNVLGFRWPTSER